MGGLYGVHPHADGLSGRPDSSLGMLTGNGDVQQPLEHVTRVRLVQFQKNTDEPMVSYQTISTSNRAVVQHTVCEMNVLPTDQ